MKVRWTILLLLPGLVQCIGMSFGIVHLVMELAPLANILVLTFCIGALIFHTIKKNSASKFLAPLLFSTCAFYLTNGPQISLTEKPRASVPIRLFSMNVGQFGNDTTNASEIAKMIRSERPDFVCLQEFGLYYKWPDVQSVAKHYAQDLGMQYFSFQPHKNNIFGTAIFSRFPIDTSILVFNQISITNEAWVHVFNLNGQTLAICNAHLESYNLFGTRPWSLTEAITKRKRQIELINSALADYPNHLILGDLNTIPGTPMFNLLTLEREDAVRSNGLGWNPTYDLIPLRIDHIIHSQAIIAIDVDLKRTEFSDHKCLSMTFSL